MKSTLTFKWASVTVGEAAVNAIIAAEVFTYFLFLFCYAIVAFSDS